MFIRRMVRYDPLKIFAYSYVRYTFWKVASRLVSSRLLSSPFVFFFCHTKTLIAICHHTLGIWHPQLSHFPLLSVPFLSLPFSIGYSRWSELSPVVECPICTTLQYVHWWWEPYFLVVESTLLDWRGRHTCILFTYINIHTHTYMYGYRAPRAGDSVLGFGTFGALTLRSSSPPSAHKPDWPPLFH